MSQSLYGGMTPEQQLNAYKQLQQHQQTNHLTPHQQQELWQQVIVSPCLLPHIFLPLEHVGWHKNSLSRYRIFVSVYIFFLVFICALVFANESGIYPTVVQLNDVECS